VLDELIADMLAKDPRDRPQTMAAVQRVLRFAADVAADGRADGGAYEVPTAPGDPSLAPPGTALASMDISMSSVPRVQTIVPAPSPAGDLGVSGEIVSGECVSGECVSGECVSGEIVVPAAAARKAERSIQAAPIAGPGEPDRRHPLLFYLCVATVAVVTAIALAVA
jgi:hypothetical protein